ncbi:MAG: aminomethyl-transferring glycine dehydrogenase [Balneolaceae bacterium]
MKISLEKESFADRHIGPGKEQIKEMLQQIGADSLEALIDETVPKSIRLKHSLNLPAPQSEEEYLEQLKRCAKMNDQFRSFIGMGYYDTITPNVILRNVIENPGWYTSYTPYQAEISQGRLEALINFQTMISDLTGMEIANASLLDEGTAAAEALSMFMELRKGSKRKANTFFVSEGCHPQTIAVVAGRAEPLGIEVRVGNHRSLDLSDDSLFGVLLQYPDTDGRIYDYHDFIGEAGQEDVLVAVAADLMSLTLLKPPGEMGADAVVGSAQRFGVPMGFGGPHAGFFATREAYKRRVPGRIIGVTNDQEGNPAYRMALQTREQHIRREKATSNICTAQVLLAVVSGFYGVWHGPKGLRRIAERIHGLAKLTVTGLAKLGYNLPGEPFFDTVSVATDSKLMEKVRQQALEQNVNLRYQKGKIGISFDEAKSFEDVGRILKIFAEAAGKQAPESGLEPEQLELDWPDSLIRRSSYMEHPVFSSFRSEHEMLRYLKRLENRDLDLTHSMISLGSCTMKLNATAEMIPLTWPEFSKLHPFVPQDQAEGYSRLFAELEEWLAEITGYSAVSLQPNSGAQGELTGLMMIRAFHRQNRQPERTVCLVPSSAHGTNPASAVMAGMDVVVVPCDDHGNIDLEQLERLAEEHRDRLAALMVTYPSTHGVFEEQIQDICALIHQKGGLVYLDGANMNAQVGLTSPAAIGADVCHLNLHKTFCIPHGGGGPGMGPVAVNEKLKPFLPTHPVIRTGGEHGISPVSAAPWGSASILSISHAYIRMLGTPGLEKATKIAILNANYLKERLKPHYPILYTGRNGRSAHEFILDLRSFRQQAGIEATDVAKRLMDYGFHAPTMSFPVPGTLMVEPTESESREELDRFCDAMIRIREEIREIEEGVADREMNLLNQAPHTIRTISSDQWNRPYKRERAAFPLPELRFNKFWPTVSRVDDAYGDRNLFCSCVPVEEWQEAERGVPGV